MGVSINEFRWTKIILNEKLSIKKLNNYVLHVEQDEQTYQHFLSKH